MSDAKKNKKTNKTKKGCPKEITHRRLSTNTRHMYAYRSNTSHSTNKSHEKNFRLPNSEAIIYPVLRKSYEVKWRQAPLTRNSRRSAHTTYSDTTRSTDVDQRPSSTISCRTTPRNTQSHIAIVQFTMDDEMSSKIAADFETCKTVHVQRRQTGAYPGQRYCTLEGKAVVFPGHSRCTERESIT